MPGLRILPASGPSNVRATLPALIALVPAIEQTSLRLAPQTHRPAAGLAAPGSDIPHCRPCGVNAAAATAAAAVIFSVLRGGGEVAVAAVEAELGLDGGGVDAVFVEAAPDGAGELHVAGGALAFEVEFDLHVQAGDELDVAELPDVQVVAGDDAGEFLDVFFDVVDADAGGDGLEEDAGGGFAEGDGRAEDYEGDDEGDEGVGIEAVGGGCEPDYEGGADDADVAEGVAHDVQEDAAHVEVVVVGRCGGSGLGVFVVGVPGVVAAVGVGRLVGVGVRMVCGPVLFVRGEEGRAFAGFVVGIFDCLLVAAFAAGLGFDIFEAAGGDDVVAEAGRVDMDGVDAVEAGAGAAVVAAFAAQGV